MKLCSSFILSIIEVAHLPRIAAFCSPTAFLWCLAFNQIWRATSTVSETLLANSMPNILPIPKGICLSCAECMLQSNNHQVWMLLLLQTFHGHSSLQVFTSSLRVWTESSTKRPMTYMHCALRSVHWMTYHIYNATKWPVPDSLRYY